MASKDEELQALIDSLRSQLAEQRTLIKKKDQELLKALQENERLRHQLNQLLQEHFGVKSEKGKHLKELFDEAQRPDNTQEIESTEALISVAAHQRRLRAKPGRKPLPSHLPRLKKIYDLEEDQKTCACGCALTKIDELSREQLDIIPARVQVIQHVRYKYACKSCEQTIKTAQGPCMPIPKSMASPGLLAHLAVSKFKDHLPLYRQEAIFKRMGIELARNTTALWLIKMATVLKPLYNLGQENIIDYDVAYADETRVQVLEEPGRKAEDKAYMWCFIGGTESKRFVLYHYNPSRAHTVIENLLGDFKGYLHCDGFAGYDAYAADHPVKLVGCWMHARRDFFKIVRSTKQPGLAATAVGHIKKLYKIEEQMKNLGLTPTQRYAYRQTHSKPVLETFKAFLEEHFPKILPKSPIGEAFAYALNQWPKLIRYLEDGRLEIDNGLSERKMKPFVLGRKNWLFCQSVAGARAAEIIFSIIESCALHQIEPYAYLRFVLSQIPYAKTVEDLEALMPYNVKPEDLLIQPSDIYSNTS